MGGGEWDDRERSTQTFVRPSMTVTQDAGMAVPPCVLAVVHGVLLRAYIGA